jgi:hypothetical protein
MKNIWIPIVVVAIILVAVILMFGGKKQSTPVVEQTITTTTQEIAQEAAPVRCTEPQCLFPHFLNCTPSELKMPFMEGTTFIITIFGVENGKCHYAAKVVDENGNVARGMPSSDCLVPVEKITENTFDHFFGADNVPGKEAIKAEQDKIEADYCVHQ